MKNKRFHLSLLVLGVLAPACSPNNDSIVVVSVDGPSTIPTFYYLRAVLSNGDSQDFHQFPTSGQSSPITLPTSLGFNIPRSRSGQITLTFDALNLQMQTVASGSATVQLKVGERADACVGLAPSGVACGGSSGSDGGVSSPDGASGNDVASLGDASGSIGGFAAGLQLSRVSAGYDHTCAVTSSGDLWCWGANSMGQVGNGNTADVLLPIRVAGSAWSDVTTGYGDSCALQNAGDLWCWGNNGSGQLGGSFAKADVPVTIPLQVPGTWTSARAGEYHVVAIQLGGSLWTWGNNSSDQLGDSSAPTLGRSSPAQVGTGLWATIATGALHSCGIQQDQSLWCWGNNSNGQLGDDTTRMHTDPARLDGTGWASVTAGLYHTCATKSDGTLWCWGGNANGQLGVSAGSPTSVLTPAKISTTQAWLSVSAGQTHTCGIQADFSLWCWGNNTDGQLGNSSNASITTPNAVSPGATWSAVSSGGSHTCAIAGDGTLWCWGSNTNGQLGVGGNAARTVPTHLGS